MEGEILATLVSALVACIVKVSLQCMGWPLAGVRRTPMLVGTRSAVADLGRRFRCMVRF
jgi:hypothetical protein